MPVENLVGRASWHFLVDRRQRVLINPWTWFSALRGDRIGNDYPIHERDSPSSCAMRSATSPKDRGCSSARSPIGSPGRDSYERLEFLGDRVLGLVVARWLYERFPSEPEGKMSRRYNALVARETCADDRPRARRSAADPPRQAGARRPRRLSDNVVGDVVEALIGASILDGGLDPADASSAALGRPISTPRRGAPQHPKSALQELAAARLRRRRYELVSRTGAHHAPRFTVRVASARRRGEADGRSQAGSRNRRRRLRCWSNARQ